MPPGPLKVLFTIPFGEPLGGAEEVLWTFLRLADRDRIEPFVIFHRPGELVGRVEGLGIRTAVVPTGRFREVHRAGAAIWRMAAIMRRERPDVIAHWLNRAQVYGAPAATLAGMRSKTMWFQRHLPDGTDRLDRVATRLPAVAIGTPSAGASAAQGALLRPARPTFHVHPGIEPPRASSPEVLGELRRRHGFPAGVPVVGIVGRLQPWKGQDRFLRALALLREGGHEVHGLVVGGTQHGVAPDYPDELHRLTDELGLTGHVTFTGQVADATPYYELLDVSVNASDQESFGLVLLEAMALGTPVVAVDHGGPAEILEHGRSGILVAQADPQDLAGGIGELIDDPERRAKIALAARERMREHFTAARMTTTLEECFEQLARGVAPRH